MKHQHQNLLSFLPTLSGTDNNYSSLTAAAYYYVAVCSERAILPVLPCDACAVKSALLLF